MDKKTSGGCGCGGNKGAPCQICAQSEKMAEELKLVLPAGAHEIKHRLAQLIIEDAKKHGATEYHRRCWNGLFH